MKRRIIRILRQLGYKKAENKRHLERQYAILAIEDDTKRNDAWYKEMPNIDVKLP